METKPTAQEGEANMKLKFLSVTIVVLAEDHNPSILHPSFLKAQGIVPADWKLAAAEPVICTPPFSMVKFDNDMVFTVENKKLQVIDNRPENKPGQSMAPKLLAKYMETLPHVHYKAIGINFSGLVECAKPESFIMERFLTRGDWNSENRKPQELGLTLKYGAPDGQLWFTINSGSAQGPTHNVIRTGILATGNYHSDLPQDKALVVATRLLAGFPAKAIDFAQTAKTILGLEE